MRKTLVVFLLGLLPGLLLAACSQDANRPAQTALSPHERMIKDIEMGGAGSGAGGGM